MTAHRRFLGTDDGSQLVQIEDCNEVSPQFLEVQETDHRRLWGDGPLRGFRLDISPRGAYFVKNGKYLCAAGDKRTVVANREQRNTWETFTLIPEHRISVHLTRKGGEAHRFRERVLAL